MFYFICVSGYALISVLESLFVFCFSLHVSGGCLINVSGMIVLICCYKVISLYFNWILLCVALCMYLGLFDFCFVRLHVAESCLINV